MVLTTPWPELPFWQSEDWASAQRKLDNMETHHVLYNPVRADLFRVLRMVSLDNVQVVIVGQDPYPQRRFATGVAFSIPAEVPPDEFPPTLRTIFKELTTDTRCEIPCTGDLTRWTAQGVLLWNSSPVVIQGKPLSCRWDEWITLTRQIITSCDRAGAIVCLVGARARQFAQYCTGHVIECAHPSPLAASAKQPFLGSRIFTRINSALVSKGKAPIDWRLDASNGSSRPPDVQRPIVGRGKTLENLTGIVL